MCCVCLCVCVSVCVCVCVRARFFSWYIAFVANHWTLLHAPTCSLPHTLCDCNWDNDLALRQVITGASQGVIRQYQARPTHARIRTRVLSFPRQQSACLCWFSVISIAQWKTASFSFCCVAMKPAEWIMRGGSRMAPSLMNCVRVVAGTFKCTACSPGTFSNETGLYLVHWSAFKYRIHIERISGLIEGLCATSRNSYGAERYMHFSWFKHNLQ